MTPTSSGCSRRRRPGSGDDDEAPALRGARLDGSTGPEFIRVGGHTSCVAIEAADGRLLVLDAGTGVRRLAGELDSRPFRGSVLLTQAMAPPHFPITPSELRGAWTLHSLDPGHRRIEGST